MPQHYIGISALHHDSTAALIDDEGNIICVRQEERCTNIKNDRSWPDNSINWCSSYANINPLDKDNIRFEEAVLTGKDVLPTKTICIFLFSTTYY